VSGGADGPGTGSVRPGPHYLRAGGRSILPVGAHVVPPEGPDWTWRVGPEAFDRAFAAMAALGLDTARIDVPWAAVEPDEGRHDEVVLRTLDAVLAAARRHGLWLHPALFMGGEVGDAFWDVPWRRGRHPHRDRDMLALQAAHAAKLAARWRGDERLLGWDLTDEPPFWPFPDTTDDDARAWTRALANAIRAADPDHLVTIGTASQETGFGPFRADVVADDLDILCVHPYAIYQPELYPDTLLSPRITRSAAFEVALASGAGKPAMLHEYGASSAQFDPEAIAAHDRLLAWSAIGRGAIGVLPWCWTDAEPEAYRRAPYVRQPHETQFGLTDANGTIRPRGRVLEELAASLRRLDIDAYAGRGPEPPAAAILVPHEYARPWDATAYGLDGAPAGPYVPAERSLHRDPDGRPLVAAWLNAYALASRAGVVAAFPRERLDDAWPDVRLLLLPAPLASTTTTLWHVRTSFWRGARDFFARGGTLFLSLSSDCAIPEMDELAGCRIADRARADLPPVLRFVASWGPFRAGDELVLPAWDGELGTRGVRLRVADAEVVAVDAGGSPALTAARRGAGRAVTCAFPVELLLASVPDAHGPADGAWGLYAGLADAARARATAGVAHPDVVCGVLRGERGAAAVLTNHADASADVTLALPSGARAARRIVPGGDAALGADAGAVALTLEPWGATMVVWDEPGR